MEALRQYILSITVAAMACGLVLSIVPGGQFRGILKLICGVFLTLMVMKPLTILDPERIFSRFSGQWEAQGEAAAAFGEEVARDAMALYIKREAEAYILDKAGSLGIDVQADVTVSSEDIPLPERVTICGNIPDPTRLDLERIIQENLGIAKEDQHWIGQN